MNHQNTNKTKNKTHKRVIIIFPHNERYQFFRNNSKNVLIIARQIPDVIHNCCAILAHHPFAWRNHRMKSETMTLLFWRKFLSQIIVKVSFRNEWSLFEKEKKKWNVEKRVVSFQPLLSDLVCRSFCRDILI